MKPCLSNRFRSVALISASAAASLTFARAADQTWNPAGPTNNWNTTGADTNWDAGVVWTQGNNAIFGGTAETVTLVAGINAGNLTFNSGTYTLTANTLTLAAGSVINTGANNATINSNLAGTGGMVKTGTGTLTLGGTGTTLSGGITLSQGTLFANGTVALGAATSTVTLGDANTGDNPLTLQVAGATFGTATTSNYGTSQTILLTGNMNLTTLNLAGNVPLTLKSSGALRDINYRVTGTGIAAGNTALTLDGTSSQLRTSFFGGSAANNFTGDVVIKGVVNTQNITYNGQTAANQNLGFLNNNVTVFAGATWTVVWGGETVGALNGSGNIVFNNQNALNNIALTVGNTNIDGSHTGVISGGFGLAKVGTATQELGGANTYTGTTTVNNGTLKLTRANGSTWSNSNVALNVANTPTLQLNAAAGAAWTFSKQLAGGSITAKIEKVGLGSVILNPAAGSSFVGTPAGALTVTGGRLYLNGAFTTAPAVSVAGGATFGGTSTAGNVTVASGGTLEGGMGGTGTLTAGNVTVGSLATDTATLKGGLSTTAGYKALAVTGLTLNGGDQTVTLDAVGLGLVNGNTYDLLVSTTPITAPNATSVLAVLKSNARAYTPQVTGNSIRLVYDSTASVYWTGGGGSVWNTAAPGNWKRSGDNSDAVFMSNDVVSFGNNPASATVNIDTANVTPLTTTFDFTSESGTAYTLQSTGAFGIATGSLTKSGSGLLTITTTNTYPGGTTVTAGTLQLGDGTTTGVIAGNIANTANVIFNNGTAQTFAGIISGSGGTLTKAGTGTLTLSGLNTYVGTTTVSQGTLNLNNVPATNTAYAWMANGITLGDANTGENDVQLVLGAAVNTTDGTFALIGSRRFGPITVNPISGGTVTINAAATGTNPQLELVLNGAVTFQGPKNQTMMHARGPGAGAGNDTLILNNPGVLTSDGTASTFGGNVRLASGTWQMQNNSYVANDAAHQNLIIPDTSSVTVDAGATWTIIHGSETIDGLNGSGTVGYYVGGGVASLGTQFVMGGGNGNGVFSGALQNGTTVGKIGTGTQELSGANIKYTGATTLNNGTLKLTNTTAWGSNITVAATGNPALVLNYENTGAAWSFTKGLDGGSATAALEKSGDGTLILAPASGPPAFGTLTVSGGRLDLNGTTPGFFASAPTATVSGTAVLGGKATLGATTVADGGTLVGGFGGTGTLSATSLTFAGVATVEGTPSLTTAPIGVSGALAATGGLGSISIRPSSIPAVNGRYHVIQYGSFGGAITDFKLASPGRSVWLDQSAGFIDLMVDTTNHPVWVGNSTEWSTANLTPDNWNLSGGGTTDFLNVDAVEFSSVATGYNIDVSATDVEPGAMTFTNDTPHDYTLGGTMDIKTGRLTMKGTGKVTITSGYTFAGGSSLENGTVSIDTETALGTGTRTFNGGALEVTGSNDTWTRDSIMGTNGGTINVATNGVTLTHAGALSGTGILTKSGPGAFRLPYPAGTITTPLKIVEGWLNLDYGGGDVTYSGQITGTSGGLSLLGTGASATAGLTLAGNMTFSGDVHIYGRRIFLDSPIINGALSGANIVFKQGHWPWHDLTLNRDEQIADTSVLRWETTNATLYEFRLNGHTETVGGLACINELAIIENAGFDSMVGNDNNVPSGTLKVNTATGTSYSYNGSLRNLNNGTGNGTLSFEKMGPGTQILTRDPSYTGATIVSGGTLELLNATLFASSSVTVNAGTLRVNDTVAGSGTGTTPTITVENGGTLAGVGNSTATITIQDGGNVAPGLGGVGTLTLAEATLIGTYQCDLNATTSDLLAVTGTLTVGSSAQLTFSGTPAATEYTIATYGSMIGSLPAVTPPAGYKLDTATTGVVKLVKTPGYATWADSFEGLTDKTPGGDPDGDGIKNLVEYVIGGDPRVSSTEFLPKRAIVGTDLVLSYQRSDASEADTTQTGQWSVNLTGWNDIAPVLVNENGTEPDAMEIRIPLANAVNGKLFGRLQVTLNP